MVTNEAKQWVLAFDDSCGTCREISAVVEDASAGRLRVAPLRDEAVENWRKQYFGVNAPWAPTLIAVDADADVDGETGNKRAVRAWTGPRMAVPLVRILGVRSGWRVLNALGRLRRRASGKADALPGAPTGRAAVGRAQFLRYAGGAAVAAGIVLTGRTPAFAEQEGESARKWAARKARAGQLPQTYAEVTAYPLKYRKAIVRASSPEVRSALWSEHLREFEANAPSLDRAQRSALADAYEVARVPANFQRGPERRNPDARLERRLKSLRQDAVDAFGTVGAVALLSRLGPAPTETRPEKGTAILLPDCGCSVSFPACVLGDCEPGNGRCTVIVDDCGPFWCCDCDGGCPGIEW